MLLQFSVSNFRSFGDEVVLSLMATAQRSRDRTLDDNVRRPIGGDRYALTSAAVLGANASGKSNLFRALHFMAQFVRDSARSGQADDPIPVTPFRLHADLRDEPSTFEVVFLHEGVRYRYGFEADRQRVHAEWLFQTRRREATVFERDGDEITGTRAMEVDALGKRTRANALFLSVASQLNHPLATELVGWFNRLGFIGGLHEAVSPFTARQLAEETDLAPAIRTLMADLDVNVGDLKVTRRKPSRDDLPGDMPAELAELLTRTERFHVAVQHQVFDEAGVPVAETWFELDDESEGTRKLFALAGPLVDTLRRGGVIIIDEFDARLHTLLGQGIVGLFNDRESNPHGAQIVVMTHDTQVIDVTRLRRDQIWFVEKDARAQSTLFSLAEIKVRNDAAAQRAYLDGRYGATPHLRLDPEALLGAGA